MYSQIKNGHESKVFTLKRKVALIHNKKVGKGRLLALVAVLEYSGQQKSKYGYYIEICRLRSRITFVKKSYEVKSFLILL